MLFLATLACLGSGGNNNDTDNDTGVYTGRHCTISLRLEDYTCVVDSYTGYCPLTVKISEGTAYLESCVKGNNTINEAEGGEFFIGNPPGIPIGIAHPLGGFA